VAALDRVVDLAAIRDAGIRIGADPLGGASVAYWGEIGERYGLDLTVVNPEVDPTFRFMTLDWDGKIRMDCSSPFAMASLIRRQHEFTIATGNDTDSDRHGIVNAGRRAAQSQPLPRRCHRLPVPAPGRLAVGRGGGQDAGQLIDDRPGGGGTGPGAV